MMNSSPWEDTVDDDRLRGPTRVVQGQAPLPASEQDLVRHPVGMDWSLLAAFMTLMTFGLTMAYSASYHEAMRHGSAEFFLHRHLIFISVGVVAMLAMSCVPYQMWQRFALPILMVAIVLMALVTIPGIGIVVKNARRWIAIPGTPFRLQPTEFAKLAFIIYLARSVAVKARRGVIETFKYGLLPHLLVFGLLSVLSLKQPDLGTALVLAMVMFAMTFVAGVRTNSLMSIGGLGAGALGIFLYFDPMRAKRILSWLDVEATKDGIGWQLWNSKVAVAAGGLFGRGLGGAQQKLGRLPEAHTDFVLAIIGEELGLIGIVFIAVGFGFIVFRGQRIAMSARDEFGRILAIGLTSLFGIQACVNMGVVLGLLPTKGLTLPLVSYGGSSILMMSVAAGLLLSIGRGGQPDWEPAPWLSRLLGRFSLATKGNRRSFRKTPSVVTSVSGAHRGEA